MEIGFETDGWTGENFHPSSQPSHAMCLFVLYIQRTDRQNISPTRAPTYLSWHRDKQDFLSPRMLLYTLGLDNVCYSIIIFFFSFRPVI